MSVIQLSTRGRTAPSSPIRSLASLATMNRGVHVHFMNIGQPDISTPRGMIEAYQSYDERVLAYAPSEGYLEYRQKLAGYYQRLLKGSGSTIEADDIIVTVGGSEALLFSIAAVTDPGDSILVCEPFYTNYAGYANMLGIDVIAVTTTPAENYHLDPARVEAALLPSTRALVIPSPGNPTGVVLSDEQLDALADICHRHGLFYISDEVYREFVYDKPAGTLAPSILSRPGTEDIGIVIDSVSKRYSACGARVGCLVTRNKDVHGAALHYAQARLSPATVDQHAAMAALDTPQSYFDEVVKEYTARRNTLVDGLQSIGIKCERPSGAFYLAVSLPVEDATAFSEWMVSEFEFDGETLCVAPLKGFYHTPGLGKNEIRMAYVLEQDILERCVKILAAALEAWKSR